MAVPSVGWLRPFIRSDGRIRRPRRPGVYHGADLFLQPVGPAGLRERAGLGGGSAAHAAVQPVFVLRFELPPVLRRVGRHRPSQRQGAAVVFRLAGAAARRPVRMPVRPGLAAASAVRQFPCFSRLFLCSQSPRRPRIGFGHRVRTGCRRSWFSLRSRRPYGPARRFAPSGLGREGKLFSGCLAAQPFLGRSHVSAGCCRLVYGPCRRFRLA